MTLPPLPIRRTTTPGARTDLGLVALILVGSALALLLAGVAVTFVAGFWSAIAVFVAAALAVLPLSAGLIVGVVAGVSGRGRVKGIAAVLVALLLGAVCVTLAVPLAQWLLS